MERFFVGACAMIPERIFLSQMPDTETRIRKHPSDKYLANDAEGKLLKKPQTKDHQAFKGAPFFRSKALQMLDMFAQAQGTNTLPIRMFLAIGLVIDLEHENL